MFNLCWQHLALIIYLVKCCSVNPYILLSHINLDFIIYDFHIFFNKLKEFTRSSALVNSV